jgi:NAD-dependent SIR2 family protein deacetylase
MSDLAIDAVSDESAEFWTLVQILRDARRLVVLSGAGCSTRSGIPDYRGPDAPRHTPTMYTAFVRSEEVRRAWWERSHRNWPRFDAARPNAAHRAIAALDPHFLITQNVDDLHQEAGSRRLVQLHGRNRSVVCLDCGMEFARADIQPRIEITNPPPCERCGGMLKPNVVFFGESVPPEKVAVAMERVDEADALLVAGSSLTVWSGFRFVKRAAARGIPIVIVNIGPTRGDELATVKIDGECGAVLSAAIGAVRSA